jgi:hypothetical protein
MVHAYMEMNLNELADDSLKVLKHNFPDYEKLLSNGTLAPYDKLYHDEVNWLNFISFGLLNKSASQDNSPSSNSEATPVFEPTPRPEPKLQAPEMFEEEPEIL